MAKFANAASLWLVWVVASLLGLAIASWVTFHVSGRLLFGLRLTGLDPELSDLFVIPFAWSQQAVEEHQASDRCRSVAAAWSRLVRASTPAPLTDSWARGSDVDPSTGDLELVREPTTHNRGALGSDVDGAIVMVCL